MPPKTPLVDPSNYFAQRTNVLTEGSLVFGFHLLGDLLLLFLVIRALLQRIDVTVPSDAWMTVLGPVVLVSVVFYLVAWLVVAAIMHYLSGGSDTAGSYTDALAVTGWAYAPEVLVLPLNWLLVRREIAELRLEGESVGAVIAELEAVQNGMFGLPDLVILLAVTVVSVYILAFGVAATHDVPVPKALGPAAIVGIGSIVLALVGAA